MRAWIVFVMLVGMSVEMIAQQAAAPASQAVTNAREIASKPNETMQKFSVEQLYSTRIVGGTAWAPKGDRIAFVSNISGANNLWVVPAEGG